MEPPASPEPLVPIALSRTQSQARDGSLVLSAEGIDHRLTREPDGFALRVREADRERAERALRAYQSDLRSASASRAPAPRPLEYGSTRLGIALAFTLPALHALERGSGLPWRALGVADAREILSGELWRTVTALTLHADAAHVLGNAAALGLFATLLFRSVGPGLGSAGILLAGALANALNAELRGTAHVSLGASSAVFGAVGGLTGLQFARRWRGLRRSRAWLPLAAGIGLLAMLGTGGERTDLSAHALGLVCGAGLGAATGFGLRAPPGAAVQRSLLWATGLTLAGAWLCAWTLGR